MTNTPQIYTAYWIEDSEGIQGFEDVNAIIRADSAEVAADRMKELTGYPPISVQPFSDEDLEDFEITERQIASMDAKGWYEYDRGT